MTGTLCCPSSATRLEAARIGRKVIRVDVELLGKLRQCPIAPLTAASATFDLKAGDAMACESGETMSRRPRRNHTFAVRACRNQRAARGLRKHEHAERGRTIAVTAARNWCIGFVVARAAIVNAAVEIDAGCPRRCSLEHEFKAPERRAKRVTDARLTFVVNGIRFHDPIGQAIPTTVLREPLQQRRELSTALQELWKGHVRRARRPIGVVVTSPSDIASANEATQSVAPETSGPAKRALGTLARIEA